MLMIELPTATLAMTAAYKETDVTIRIRSNRYYSAEYRIAVNPTIRPRSEYEANIRYSPSPYHFVPYHFVLEPLLWPVLSKWLDSTIELQALRVQRVKFHYVFVKVFNRLPFFNGHSSTGSNCLRIFDFCIFNIKYIQEK